eukprot:Em0015g405a
MVKWRHEKCEPSPPLASTFGKHEQPVDVKGAEVCNVLQNPLTATGTAVWCTGVRQVPPGVDRNASSGHVIYACNKGPCSCGSDLLLLGICVKTTRARYKADPEKKKASLRDSYKADPKKKKASVRDSYKVDPEKKKASVRDSYKADPEKKKASVRDSYNADIESKQSAKRQRYQEDLEESRAA